MRPVKRDQSQSLATIIRHLRKLHRHLLENDFSTRVEDRALENAIQVLKELQGVRQALRR